MKTRIVKFAKITVTELTIKEDDGIVTYWITDDGQQAVVVRKEAYEDGVGTTHQN